MFGSSSSLPPFVSEGGGLVCDSDSKADLTSNHFDSKQSREAVYMPLTCHPCPNLTTFAFRSNKVRLLLLDLDPMVALFFLRELLMSWPPSLCSVSVACSSG